jgi:hypothetical protein
VDIRMREDDAHVVWKPGAIVVYLAAQIDTAEPVVETFDCAEGTWYLAIPQIMKPVSVSGWLVTVPEARIGWLLG